MATWWWPTMVETCCNNKKIPELLVSTLFIYLLTGIVILPNITFKLLSCVFSVPCLFIYVRLADSGLWRCVFYSCYEGTNCLKGCWGGQEWHPVCIVVKQMPMQATQKGLGWGDRNYWLLTSRVLFRQVSNLRSSASDPRFNYQIRFF